MPLPTTRTKVMTAIVAARGLPRARIVLATGLTGAQVDQALKRLHALGWVRRETRTSPARWLLTPVGRQLLRSGMAALSHGRQPMVEPRT
jgi:DNA-binding MarR family transcriptional regulator